MRGLLSYVDPTKPLRWMLGGAPELWRKKKTVILYCTSPLGSSGSMCHTPASPSSVGSPVSPYRPQPDLPVDWVREAGYDVVDWRDDPHLTIATALQAVSESLSDTCVIASDNPKLIQQALDKGLPVESVLFPQEGLYEVPGLNVPTEAPRLTGSTKVVRYRPNPNSLRTAVTRAIGKGLSTLELTVEVLSDEGEAVEAQEMSEYCPFKPLLAEMKNSPDTLSALLAVSENLLYRGMDVRYRRLIGSTDKFKSTFGSPSGLEFLRVLGFERVTDCDPSPQYIIPDDAPLNTDLLQKAATVINKQATPSP